MKLSINIRAEGMFSDGDNLSEVGTSEEVMQVLRDALLEFQDRKQRDHYYDGGPKQARMLKRCRIADFIKNNLRRVCVSEVID